MLPRCLLLAAFMLVLAGCCYPVRQQADRLVCDLAAQPLDLEPCPPGPQAGSPGPAAARESEGVPGADAEVRPVAAQETKTGEPTLPAPRPLSRGRTLLDRLTIPPTLPGANAPPIPAIPRYNPQNPQEQERAINRYFPALPELGPEPTPVTGPEGRPLTLSDLEHLAMTNSPLLRQAAADVEAAKGAAIQAGAYPNPNFGYEADNVGTGNTAGFQGIFIDQVIKTGGKLKLAQAAATMDLLNAQLALRRAQADLLGQVRAGYFAVLAARESVKVSRALTELADSAFGIQVDQLRGGELATYEPLQLRVLSMQARGALVQARNRYQAAWKQLAATLGLPGMPLTELAGGVDRAIPVFQFDKLQAAVLSKHTDVLTAQNTVQKNRYNLSLAQMTPVPDVSIHWVLQKDYSVPPFAVAQNLQMGVPLPVWDQNKGNIIQAQGNLLRSVEEAHRVRSDLSGRLAEAFERYEDNRRLMEYYRDWILPDQVRAYRGIYQRHWAQPDIVSFGDIVTAQQTLATAVTTYITTLGTQWTAVVDLGTLLQTADLFQMNEAQGTECVAPVPDLHQLATLPCCHPCSPVTDPTLKGADPSWHPAMPQTQRPPQDAGKEKARGTARADESDGKEITVVQSAVEAAKDPTGHRPGPARRTGPTQSTDAGPNLPAPPGP